MFSRIHGSFSAILTLTLLFLVSQSFSRNTCGTDRLFQNIRAYRENPELGKKALARATIPCPAESFYDTVYSKKTEHFQIFYTISGPNQTTEEFIDSVASNAEFAYKIYATQLGMLPPLGSSRAFHYQQEVEAGLYPIEVIDIDQMRGTQFYLGGKCHGCYGLMIPDDDDPSKSELFMDNDFRYTPEYNATKDTLMVDGKKCIYDIADQELMNEAHGYSYADQWEKGIRVTAFHELYHAVQIRYLDMTSYMTFWFEASASGMEEILAPEIDDYFAYLPLMSQSVGTPLDNMIQDYGAGIFLLYLHNHVEKNFDKLIWESFAKEPNKILNVHLDKIARKKNLSMDSIFHDFSTRLAFSGKRSGFVDSTEWIDDDEKDWPEFLHITIDDNRQFTPHLQNFAYQYYAYGRPSVENFTGRVSVASYRGETAEIVSVTTSNAADSLYIALSGNPSVDSISWIFSRFGENTLPTIIKDSTLRAYPVPWRRGDLCFTPLPLGKKFLEIRNRRGDLVTREKYEAATHCINEDRVKKILTPGVYRFRAGSRGKTQDFIVIY